jgi:hypothetical protein
MKYSLGDYTIKNWNSWDRVPRDPVTVGAMILSGGTVAATGTALYVGQLVVGYLVTTAITSWAMNALAPRPDLGSLTSRGILVNAKDATAPAEFVYGEVRKGGVITYYESTGETNKYLHQIIVLAAHEVNNIGDIYINDTVVTLDGSGFVTSDGWNSKIRIQKFDGSQTTAPADLLSESELTGDDALDANFVGNGLAYLYVRYEFDQDVFANGIPLITAVIQGKKVYDPRTSTTGYSNNAALCIRDFLTAEYGLNDSAIDDVSFAAAANECDESVALSGGGTESRYTINGIVRADRDIGSTLGDMMAACAGTLFWGSGYWKLKAGAYSAPVKTLTLDDLRGSISLDTRITLRDNFNEVQGTFNDASQDWITVDYPKLTSAAFLTEDGGSGNETALDLQLPYTTSAAAAQRLAKLTLFRGREQMTLTAEFGMNAFDIEVGDIIALDNDRYGWTAKEFEVIGWRLAANQDAGDLRVALTLRETSEAAFDWNAEESAIIGNNTVLPDITAGLAVSALSVSQVTQITSDGTHTVFARFNWDAAFSAFVDHYEVQWRKTSDTDYQSTITSENSLDTGLLIDGVNYTVRVRAITQSGYRGAFSSTSFTASADTVAPSAPTSVSVDAGYRQNIVKWTNPTDNDFKEVEVYVNTSNTTSGASLLGTSSGTEFVHGGLAQNTTRYYFLKAKDFTGNASSFSSGASGTTLADPTAGEQGEDGATGDTVISGRVYYQVLQSGQPSTPSATSYNVSTASFSGLTANWALTQPSVDITDTSVKEWSSAFTVTIDGVTSAQTIVFTTPTGAIQVNADIESDNYVAGTSGWKIERDTGFAEFGSAAIRGTLTVGQVPDLTASKITDLATVATSGAASDVTGLATVATSGDYADITNTPDLSSYATTAQLGTKNTVFAQPSTSTPTALEDGDLWYQTDTLEYYRWNGSAWTEVTLTADSIVAGTIDANVVTVNNLDATKITAGTLEADHIKLTGSQLQNSGGVLVISSGGVDTAELANDAVNTSKIAATLQSTNYISGTSGWQINKSGSVEFQDATIRGSLNASDITAGTLNVDRLAGLTREASGTYTATINDAGTISFSANQVSLTGVTSGNKVLISITATVSYGSVECYVSPVIIGAPDPFATSVGLSAQSSATGTVTIVGSGAATSSTVSAGITIIPAGSSSTNRDYNINISILEFVK